MTQADLSPINSNTDMWVTSGPTVSGQVTRQADAPRSYNVETPNGKVGANRTHSDAVSPNQATSGNWCSVSVLGFILVPD